MKHCYTGFVIFFRSNKQGAGFGFIYNAELDKNFHFNERALASSDYQTPHVGDSVSFEPGIDKSEGKGPTAIAVRSVQLPSAPGAVISLSAVAEVYRQSVTQLRRLLGSQLQVDAPIEFITIQQLLAVGELVAQEKNSGQSEREPVIRHVGKVVRYKEESGYGFIERAGFDDVFVHVNSAAPSTLETGAWVVFTQSTNPKDPNKLRATNVKSLASETTYLRANLATFTDHTLLILLEHGGDSLSATILDHLQERIDYESTFDKAKQVIELVEKYQPQDATRYKQTIGQRLTGEAAWYWWNHYGTAEAVPEEALFYYNEAAAELTGDAENGFDLLGTLLLRQLPLSHFIALFQARWPYERVLESVQAEEGQQLIADCRYMTTLDALNYDSASLIYGHAEARNKIMWLVRYLASLEIAGLAELMFRTLHIVLPIPAFVAALPDKTESEYLTPLLTYGIPEVDAIVVPQLFQRLGAVATADTFVQLVKLLKLCRKIGTDASVTLATELALRGCNPFYQAKLWTLELVPNADIYQLLDALSSSEVRAYMQEAYAPVRLPAATILLLRAAEMGSDASISQGVYVLRNSRSLLADEDFELLLQVYPAAGSLYAEVNRYLDGQQTRPTYSVLLTWLLVLHEQAPAEIIPLINFLAAEERVEFFYYVAEVDSVRLLGLNSAILVQWLIQLEKLVLLDLQPHLVRSRRNDLLLDLWIGGHSEYFDFARYYLLVATLPREQQFLFLRKVFGLMASGVVQLTVEDLDSIPRHSREDNNPLDRRLDYSIDLVLRVLTKLKRNSAYPGENDIVDCLISYAGNSTKELLQFSHLFARCTERTSFKYDRPQDIVRVLAVIGSKTYPAADDKSYIVAGEEQFPVVQNAIIFNGKRYPIKWDTEVETQWTWSYYKEASNGSRNVTCCEGKKAPAVDKVTDSPFWWCFGRPCHKANQIDSLPTQWQQFVLKDFIQIAGLRFEEEAYYRIIGLINRINELLTKLYCKECGTMLRPLKTSDFNFYRVTKFNCTADECSSRGKVIYLNRCLNRDCASTVDSRVSVRCNYDDLGHLNWTGMYICDNCGGCCSKNKLQEKIDNMKQIYGDAVNNQSQYKSLVKQLELKLYHADNFKSYCHKCLSPMKKDSEKKPNYSCPTCQGVKYAYPVAYLTVYNKKKATVFDEQQDS
jgi:cold shock CspA family protein